MRASCLLEDGAQAARPVFRECHPADFDFLG
jgi:hypothetical protein